MKIKILMKVLDDRIRRLCDSPELQKEVKVLWLLIAGAVGALLLFRFRLEVVTPSMYSSIRHWVITWTLAFGAFELAVLTALLTALRSRLSRNTSPADARFLILLLMPNATGDALLGDLEERFHRIANDETLGLTHAHFWYWFQVIISLRPLVWACLKRITGLAVTYEAIRRIIR
jgi:hypothetical protein